MIRMRLNSSAFSMMELMLVIGILSVLGSVLFVSVQNKDRAAKIEQCKANLLAIAEAMENFKANDGEYIHSGVYKYRENGTLKTLDLNFGTAESTKFYNSVDTVDIAKLIEHGNVKICKAFKNLPVQCPADGDKRSSASTSYRIQLNPYNYTIYCTCSTAHSLQSGFPRYVHGTGTNGQITVNAKLQTNADE